MKILLIHHNASNLGDVAIVEATINQVSNVFSGCQITLESSNPRLSSKKFKNIKIVPRLFDVSGIIHTKKIISLEFAFKNLKFLMRVLKAILASQFFLIFKYRTTSFEVLKEYRDADVILSVAGDSISPDYAYFLRFYEINLAYRLGKPLILYAQSIGPFKGRILRSARKYLSRVTAIFARDETTFRLMREYNINTKVFRTADTVISLQPKEGANIQEAIKKYGINDNTFFIVLRTKKYLHCTDDEYNNYLHGMYQILQYAKHVGLSPLLVSSIPEDTETERDFINRFHLNINVLKLYDYLPSEVKSILRKGKILISPRMHPIILASTVGIPVVGQGREFKMRNYLRLIEMEDFFVNMIPMDISAIRELIHLILGNYPTIKRELDKKLLKAVKLSEDNGEYLKDLYTKLI